MLAKINSVLNKHFYSKENLLTFYQTELPKRVQDFRLDEVGPIMSAGTADEINGYLNNCFSFNGICVEMGRRINWYAAPNGDLEWNGGFVRHGYFMYLADAYTATGDEKYAQTIISQMLDYIHNVPPFNPEGVPYLKYKQSTWRPFEVAGRVSENWPVALKQIINSPSMTPDAFAEIFYSIYEHAKFLLQHHWRTGNHACLEVAGLGVISIFYQEFKEAVDWRNYAVDFLMNMITKQFFKDGYTEEMSGAYHWVAMRNFFAFYDIAKKNQLEAIFPSNYIQILEKASYAEFYQQKPDYSLPVTNDSNVLTRHKSQLAKLGTFINKKILLYRLSNTQEGIAPPNTSHYFKDARLAIMRSDWTSEAIYGSFDMGPWGSNHMNQDQLNFELSAFGRNLLVNCGRYRYTTSPDVDWIEEAEYFKTTASYNSVIVNGLNQMPGDATGMMELHDTYDYAKGVFSFGYGQKSISRDEIALKTSGMTSNMICSLDCVRHEREVFFSKNDFFIIRDRIVGVGPLTATQIWHMCDGDVVVMNNSCIYSTFEDANFIMLQLNPSQLNIFHGSVSPMKGWTCPHYDLKIAAPELNFTITSDTDVIFETLIIPVKGPIDNTNIPAFTKLSDGIGCTYQIKFPNKTITVAADDKLYII